MLHLENIVRFSAIGLFFCMHSLFPSRNILSAANFDTPTNDYLICLMCEGMSHCKHVCTECQLLHQNVGPGGQNSGQQDWRNHLIGCWVHRLECMARQLLRISVQTTNTGNMWWLSHILLKWRLTGLKWEMSWTWIPSMEGKQSNLWFRSVIMNSQQSSTDTYDP